MGSRLQRGTLKQMFKTFFSLHVPLESLEFSSAGESFILDTTSDMAATWKRSLEPPGLQTLFFLLFNDGPNHLTSLIFISAEAKLRPYVVAVNASKHVRKELKADVWLQCLALLVGLMNAEQGMRPQCKGCIWEALLHLSSSFAQIRMAHLINFLLLRENPRKEFVVILSVLKIVLEFVFKNGF